MKPLVVMGLNSGTSMDGIDAAVFSIKPKGGRAHGAPGTRVPALAIELLGSQLIPFDGHFRKNMERVVGSGAVSLKDICLMNAALGEVFAAAAISLMKSVAGKVDLIGSHGQTLWHEPDPKPFWGTKTAATLQMGEPAVIAQRTGIPVVADFRPADIAQGGQGAPIVAFADEVLFGQDNVATGVLNIGGIANITILDKTGQAKMAFDTGPGNMIIDRACQVIYNSEYDRDGLIAAEGKVHTHWLDTLLLESYFKRRPPKTTGRELFGRTYADDLLAKATQRGLSLADSVATVTALTARSIAQAYSDFVLPEVKIERLVLGGGGADNPTLVKMLTDSWPHPIKIQRHEEFGISTKFKEALLFALLAYTTYFGIPNNVPSCTGARRRVCLGKLVRP